MGYTSGMRFLRWCLLGIGGLIVGAAGVSPQDATSNLAAWIELLGFDPPSWIADVSIDAYGLAIGSIIVVLSFSAIMGWGPKTTVHVTKPYFRPKPEAEEPDDLTERRQPDNGPQDLRLLTNMKLRNEAIDLANNMRVFEANYHGVSRSLSTNLPRSATEDQRHAQWESDLKKDHQRRAAYETEFKTRFRPLAVAIRHEIARRLGIFPPYDNPDIVLDKGMLAGPSPVSEAADLIDELARRLP